MSLLLNVPVIPHYAIIQQISDYIPGNERSRNNLEHGYQDSTESYTTYQAFIKREDWIAEIERLTRQNKKFRAIYASPATIHTSFVVDVQMPVRD